MGFPEKLTNSVSELPKSVSNSSLTSTTYPRIGYPTPLGKIFPFFSENLMDPFNKESDFWTVLKSIFPDAHDPTIPEAILATRKKIRGLDLRSTDFTGRLSDTHDIGTVQQVVDDSLEFSFECSYGKILISSRKLEEMHFHPLEILELSRAPSAINIVMETKKIFNAEVLYPIKQVKRIDPYKVPKPLI